jgi:hypothetical protein
MKMWFQSFMLFATQKMNWNIAIAMWKLEIRLMMYHSKDIFTMTMPSKCFRLYICGPLMVQLKRQSNDVQNAWHSLLTNIQQACSIIYKSVWTRNTPNYTFDDY